LASCYNVFTNAYYAAYKIPDSEKEIMRDQFVEVLFFIDMIFCFFQEFKDDETFKIETKFKSIAKEYGKKRFVFDFLAWLPVDLIILQLKLNNHHDKFHLVRLLKMFRLPRLAELLDVEKFRSIVNNYYQNQLDKSVE
jgi:hypothetical protein